MRWAEGDRVQAGHGQGDGRQPISEGMPGTVRKAVGEGERWLLTIAWDSDPAWTFLYRPDEVERLR